MAFTLSHSHIHTAQPFKRINFARSALPVIRSTAQMSPVGYQDTDLATVIVDESDLGVWIAEGVDVRCSGDLLPSDTIGSCAAFLLGRRL